MEIPDRNGLFRCPEGSIGQWFPARGWARPRCQGEAVPPQRGPGLVKSPAGRKDPGKLLAADGRRQGAFRRWLARPGRSAAETINQNSAMEVGEEGHAIPPRIEKAGVPRAD